MNALNRLNVPKTLAVPVAALLGGTALAVGTAPSASAATLIDDFTTDLEGGEDTGPEPDLETDSQGTITSGSDSPLPPVSGGDYGAAASTGGIDALGLTREAGLFKNNDLSDSGAGDVVDLNSNDNLDSLRYNSPVETAGGFAVDYTGSSGSNFDVTGGGANTQFNLAFGQVDPGNQDTTSPEAPEPPSEAILSVEDASGNTGSEEIVLNDDLDETTVSVAFSSLGSSVDFSNLSQLRLTSGGDDNTLPDAADIEVDRIEATPFGFSPGMGLGALGLLYGGAQLRRRWKRKQAS